MWPVVKSGDPCQFEPFPEGSSVADSINVDDVVFCAVQPNNLYYAHFLLEKLVDACRNQYYCIIGKMDGYRNGYCYMGTIYGKLSWTGDV